jgi:hypothetical protein
VVVILPVFGGPILLRRLLTQPFRATLRPLDPEAGEAPPPVVRHFRQIAEQLNADGFRLMGYFLLGDQVHGVKATLGYLEHPTSGESALASALYAQVEQGVWRLKMAYLEFTAEFVDGTAVSTHNSTTLGAFGTIPGRTVAQFPRERDPRQLYRLHQAMVRRFGSAAARCVRGEQTVVEYLQDQTERQVERQIPTGYYVRDERAGVYRPTWKGAVLMAWKLLPPISAVRWLLLLRRAARLRRLAAAEGVE